MRDLDRCLRGRLLVTIHCFGSCQRRSVLAIVSSNPVFLLVQRLKAQAFSSVPNMAFNPDPAAIIFRALFWLGLPVSVLRPACGWAG
jgi:hypothetical protein